MDLRSRTLEITNTHNNSTGWCNAGIAIQLKFPDRVFHTRIPGALLATACPHSDYDEDMSKRGKISSLMVKFINEGGYCRRSFKSLRVRKYGRIEGRSNCFRNIANVEWALCGAPGCFISLAKRFAKQLKDSVDAFIRFGGSIFW